MQEAYVELNKVPTKITTYGRWIEESNVDVKDIVIILPGNPGVNGFYDVLAKTLHHNLGFPVWCIGHSGHNLPPKSVTPIPKFEENKHLYDLNGQVQHKVDFFEKYVPKNARVHLIGHSIGCYMILEILEHPAVKDKVVDAYLLFPVIEYMAETKNGQFLINYIKPIVPIILFFTWILRQLPDFLVTILLYIYMIIHGLPTELHCDNIKELLKPGILRRVFFLACKELEQVKERNNNAIKKNLRKIKFYYGATDAWTPPNYCDNIQVEVPGVNAQICNINHTFVFRDSKIVANTVTGWIKAKQ